MLVLIKVGYFDPSIIEEGTWHSGNTSAKFWIESDELAKIKTPNGVSTLPKDYKRNIYGVSAGKGFVTHKLVGCWSPSPGSLVADRIVKTDRQSQITEMILGLGSRKLDI